MSLTICFATNNNGKLQEIKSLIETKYSILSLKEINCFEELPETGTTLESNSLQKASFVYSKFNTNCFADDTGLEVEALKGAPGVYSARFAGPACLPEENMALLLLQLKGETNRKARFRTCITLILDGKTVQFEGEVKGRITETKQGDEGFGYDPIFVPDGYSTSFAEMSIAEKNKISHRAIAGRKLIEYLNQLK